VTDCNPLRAKLYLSNLKTQSVPRSRHCLDIKTDKLMLYREIIAVCSQIHAKYIKYINVLCGQNTDSLNVKAGGTSSKSRL
jgi:hypothetical protein